MDFVLRCVASLVMVSRLIWGLKGVGQHWIQKATFHSKDRVVTWISLKELHFVCVPQLLSFVGAVARNRF